MKTNTETRGENGVVGGKVAFKFAVYGGEVAARFDASSASSTLRRQHGGRRSNDFPVTISSSG